MDEVLITIEALANRTRKDIVSLLANKGTAITSGQIAEILGLRHGTVSSHLGQLERAGVLTKQHSGSYVLYNLNKPKLHTLAQWTLDISVGKQ